MFWGYVRIILMEKKKKIGIVSLGYGWLPCESGPSRFYYICKVFTDNGYDVELVTTGFQHFDKKPRDKEKIYAQNYPFRITFIDAPAYDKNIDFKRLYSNYVYSKRVYRYLNSLKEKYDVVYCSIPSNITAMRVGQYCHENNIPFIVDIEDLWPEAMEMVVKNSIARKGMFPIINFAEKAYDYADAVIGTSDEYTDRAFKYKKHDIMHSTVYVGCDMDQFDGGIRQFSAEIEKPVNEKWVTYAGSIGTSYNIDNLVRAAKLLQDEGRDDIVFKILGGGPEKENCEKLAQELGCRNVDFVGYAPYTKMAAYLSKSDITVNSFVKGAPQSIVNKVGDYLAGGKPMINNLESPEFCGLVEKYGFGVNIAPGDAEAMKNAVLEILSSPKYDEMCRNARNLAETRFDRKTSYLEMVRIADQLTGGK